MSDRRTPPARALGDHPTRRREPASADDELPSASASASGTTPAASSPLGFAAGLAAGMLLTGGVALVAAWLFSGDGPEAEDVSAARSKAAEMAPVVYPQRQLRPGEECVACMSAPRDHLCVPCGHVVLCANCTRAAAVRGMRRCPLCRVELQKPWMQRVFL